MNKTIISLIIIFSTVTWVMMLWQFYRTRNTQDDKLSLKKKSQLVFTGIIAFVADTIGVGSFAVQIFMSKCWNLVQDQQIPGLLNGAQIVAGAIESILFLKVIHVQTTVLLTLVAGACLGGILGGLTVSRLNRSHTQLTMSLAFFVMTVLILINQLHLLPIGGNAVTLSSWKLVLGFLGMIVCGFLPALGVGLFALVELLLFLLGLSPLIAFPIMTTAGALQQPLTTFAFVMNKRVPLRETLIIGLAGVVGVLITVPFVTHLSITGLHWLLLVIVLYNAITLFRSYQRSQRTKKLAIKSVNNMPAELS